MPVGIKDIIETVDMPTEMGSPLFAGWRSEKDAASVRALRDAGAVILGKTVTTEFAASEPRGTRNPWNTAHTPGGSSSGSAASVATGIVSAALGTQVIGSTIRPASFCGCFGFKPSVNALNREGSHDYQSQSCTGILAASLEDAGRSPTRSSHASAAMPARRACKGRTGCRRRKAAHVLPCSKPPDGKGRGGRQSSASMNTWRSLNPQASKSARGITTKRSRRSRADLAQCGGTVASLQRLGGALVFAYHARP